MSSKQTYPKKNKKGKKENYDTKPLKKKTKTKKLHHTYKVHVMRLVLLITGFFVWFLIF